ncbi:endo-1,4-beta-xylanase [Streptomyces poonensis]|uniref:Beta-xylanase n=1 Tax=Streptomyces poonensis TaxID=68255 RepID=A0A918UKJ7_9ACTN|nr:endo-1,4-beta-xylanase [Streptomyces poonensis]GGZ16379.1 beta-xylanase [Streptomyces poonensis]GLJ90855.1 beta-xylanase [Streptomyces poonensis]
MNRRNRRTRRFRLPALALLSGTLLVTGAAVQPASATPDRAHSPATLRALADRAHVKIGTAVDGTALAEDATYRRITAREFNSVTAENAMKWESVEPERGEYDWTQADELVRFAHRNGQVVRGHTLVWHSQLPAWLTAGVADGSIGKAELRSILRNHITTEVKRYKGRIQQWDVVNEVFEEDGSYRNSIWLQQLGPSYIADAFRWAHAADPKAKLFMNDYNVEGVNAKSTAYYDLAKQLLAEGVPVQGFGIQGHLATQYGFPGQVAENLARFGALGMQTAFTEVDVRVLMPADEAKLATQATYFRGLLDACLNARSCKSFTVWGFTDKYSWVPDVFPEEGAATLMDEEFGRKPAYAAVRDGLAAGR